MAPRIFLVSPSAERGFSLVELMVALAISVFLLLGISYIYVGSKNTFRNEEALARMQENGRLAFEYLTQDLRMAGYFGCATRVSANGGYLACPGGTQIGKVVNTLKNPTAFAYNFRQAVVGYNGKKPDNDSNPGTATSDFEPSLPAGIPTNNTDPKPLANSDVVIMRGTFGLGITVTAHPGGNPPGSADIKVNTTTGLNDGDIVVVSDCQSAGIFTITNINAGQNVVHNTGENPTGGPENDCRGLGKEYTGADLLKAVNRAYFVALDPTSGLRTLYRQDAGASPQALLPGVESMQIKYGWGGTVAGYPDNYYTANEIDAKGVDACKDKTGGTSTGDQWDCVKSIRVEILLVAQDNGLTTARQVLWFNGATYTPSDKRLRFAMTTVIGVRNRHMLSTD